MGVIAFITYFLTLGLFAPSSDFVEENLGLFILAWPMTAFFFYILLNTRGVYLGKEIEYSTKENKYFSWLLLPALTWLPFSLLYFFTLIINEVFGPSSDLPDKAFNFIYLFLQLFIPFPILKDYGTGEPYLSIALTIIEVIIIFVVASLPLYRRIVWWQRILLGLILIFALTQGTDYALSGNFDSMKYFLRPSSL